MRVTVRGMLLGGSVGVLITTALLWTQCRPPITDPAIHSDQSEASQLFQQQQRRQPLMTNHQMGLGGGPAADTENDYMDMQLEMSELEHSKRNQDNLAAEEDLQKEGAVMMGEIPCVINQETTIACRRDDNDVYIPFSFIHNYFEIYGRLSESSDGNEVFEWSHSYSHVFEPKKPYQPTAQFLNFLQFNVEARERVKCISAIDGVPISIQWESSGYKYPIQIAQFGLSHYSKYLEEPKPKRVLLEDGFSKKSRWKFDKFANFSRYFNIDLKHHVVKFATPESLSSRGVILHVSESTPSNLMTMNLHLRFAPNVNSSVTVTLQSLDKKAEVFYIHYICSSKLIETQNQHIYYGLGHSSSWRYLTRNLMVDILKGAAISSQPKRMRKRLMKSKQRIISIEFRGKGEFTNLTLANNEHIRHFYDAANWLINNQDERGGWSIPVARKVIPGLIEVGPGWYSAMAQGQAMSLLVRAASFSGDQRYIDAATKATNLFFVNASQGGIRTFFPGGYVWYEEYPTNPSLFVLNGFMYSLLGLYDLKVYTSDSSNPSVHLFEEGMKSLKKLLPLFDSGQGSLYDLRHFTSHVAPNLARWDYHTTHITQLLTLAAIDKGADTLLYDTAKRWKEYMFGRRARHN